MQRIPQIFPGWQADELIGQGAYGKVYKASRTEGGHTSHAAIKIIEIPRDESEVASLRSMGMDALSIRSYFEETAQSVVSEIAVMDSLKGAPNVVAIEDYKLLDRSDGVGWTIFIRMELLEDLASYQERVGMRPLVVCSDVALVVLVVLVMVVVELFAPHAALTNVREIASAAAMAPRAVVPVFLVMFPPSKVAEKRVALSP